MKLTPAQKRYLAVLLATDPKPQSFARDDRTMAVLERMGLVGDLSPVMRATGYGHLSPMYKLTDEGRAVAQRLAAVTSGG